MTLNIYSQGDRKGTNLNLINMEKMNNGIFGKFQRNKIANLSSIKGGLVYGDTKTTLCATTESTFDTDSTSNGENVADKRCPGN